MYDSKVMLDLGLAFLNAGEANFHERAIMRRSEYQNVAGVVNLAFACELFIKCLLNINGNKGHGHNINHLWDEHKRACRDNASEIEKTVMECLSTNFTFEEMLQNDDFVFVDYRYFFESKHWDSITSNTLRPQFLRVFAKTLYNYICNELPY